MLHREHGDCWIIATYGIIQEVDDSELQKAASPALWISPRGYPEFEGPVYPLV
jgi:hypothetical protein